MPQSLVSSIYHCVWSTKQRRPFITANLQERLWAYIGGIVREHKSTALCVGGVADHVHVLLSLHKTIALSKMIQLVKGGSSKWVHDTFPEHGRFAWQEGYGAFSIGTAQVPDTRQYIETQEEHHRSRGYMEEFRLFLDRNHVEYDERYVWD